MIKIEWDDSAVEENPACHISKYLLDEMAIVGKSRTIFALQ